MTEIQNNGDLKIEAHFSIASIWLPSLIWSFHCAQGLNLSLARSFVISSKGLLPVVQEYFCFHLACLLSDFREEEIGGKEPISSFHTIFGEYHRLHSLGSTPSHGLSSCNGGWDIFTCSSHGPR